MAIYEEDAEEDAWLKEHKKHHQDPEKKPPEPAGANPDSWRRRRDHRQSPRPIRVTETKQKCPHCQQEAAMELFRDTKCLACQVADYLGPIH